jgi:hypothetical protein
MKSKILAPIVNMIRPSKGRLKYHFIHIPKCGGNSIRAALGNRNDVSLSRPFHHRYVDIADNVGRDLTFFCVVRNPWSRTASRFVFARQNAENWDDDDPRKIYIKTATFDDFVRDQKVFPIPQHPGQPWMGPMSSWMNQLEWITDENNTVKCDCLRLEHINDDISAYFSDEIALPNRNITKERYDYREMYSDELRGIIAATFRDDIDYFGFEFDGAATKNVFAVR